MANPTTNFGWVMPNSADLVTDLPADFNIFGQGVDTSMVGLLGGTTGQVLSKTSGTNMAFTWVTTDDANAIQNSIMDAKGDLIGATADNTPVRLAVGTNNQVLTADSTQSTGIKWATPSAGATNWSLLNSGGTALTAAASVTVTFTAPKKIMVLMIGASSATARSFFTLRPNNISTADYSVAGTFFQIANATANSYIRSNPYGAYSTGTAIDFGTMTNSASSQVNGACSINLTDQTGWKDFSVTAAGSDDFGEGNQVYLTQGILEAAATITSITVISSAGNFDAGTVYILGAN